MNVEKKFVLFILIIGLIYLICEKQNKIVEGLSNDQCTMLGKIPVIGTFLKSFLCPIQACNANNDTPTTKECNCNEIKAPAGKYCYTDKGTTDVRDTIRDPCEDMDCGLNSERCQNGVCECKDGFEGDKCEVEKERCSNDICNNGTVEPGFVSDGCKCTCLNGWGNEEGWNQDPSKICSKRIRSSLKNSPCITNGLCSKIGPKDSDYICNIGYYLNGKDCKKCPDRSTNQSKENISTMGSISMEDCVCDSPSEYMKIDNGEGTCTKCPGVGKIKGIKNTGDPSKDCVCDTENGYLDKGDGNCVKCPSSIQSKLSGSPPDAFKWDPVNGFCGCNTPSFVASTIEGVNTCISNPSCMVNPETGPTSNKDLPFDKSNKCNGETVKKQLKELAEKDSSLEILRDDEMLKKYMNTIKCDNTTSSCICPDGVSDKEDGLFNEKCHGCKDGKVLTHSKSHDGTKEIDVFTCVKNPCIYSKGGEELKKVQGLGCFDSFDFGQDAGSRQVDKMDSKSIISVDDNDNFVFYDVKGEKSNDLSKLSEICPTGNKCGAEIVKGVGESEEPWKKDNPCWPLNEQTVGAKQWWKFVDGKCVCTVPKKYRIKDKDGYQKCIPSSCWDFSNPKKPKSVCKVNNDLNKPNKEVQEMTGDPPGCITTAVGPECQCKKGFFHSEPTQEEPIPQCTVKTTCDSGEDNSPEDGEKYKPGHWRKEELDAWLKAPGGTGIMQEKDPVTGKARVLKEDSVLNISKEDSVGLSDWPKINNIDVNFVVAWSPKRTKLPSPTQTNASPARRLYSQHTTDPNHPVDHSPVFNLPNGITDANYVKMTNEDIFYTKDMDRIYKTSYLDHKGNWIHKCDCGVGGEVGLNPLTNCKCKFDEYLDLNSNTCVSYDDAELTSKIDCSDRGDDSNWNKSNVGDFYNLYNPKCIMKGKGGYITEKGNELKEKCCVSCANKFYDNSAVKDPKLFASPPASGYWGREKAWNNAYCKNKAEKGDKWGKIDQKTVPNCVVDKDLDINDFPTLTESLLPTSNLSHQYADNGRNLGSLPPYMRQMMALGTNTRPPVWATGKDLDTTTDQQDYLTTRRTTDHYDTPFKIKLEHSSYSDISRSARKERDYSEMFKENVFYCKRTNKTSDGSWGDEPVQIHNSYWDGGGERQKSAATNSRESKIAGGGRQTAHDGSRGDDLYKNKFYSFDPKYEPEFTYPVRGGGNLTQWGSGIKNESQEFSTQPNDHDGPKNNDFIMEDANGNKKTGEKQNPLMAPLVGSNIGVKRHSYIAGVPGIATGVGWSPNFAGRTLYMNWAIPWKESDNTAGWDNWTGSNKADDASKDLGARGSADREKPSEQFADFQHRRNPNTDPITPKLGGSGYRSTHKWAHQANNKIESTCAFSHDGCQGFLNQAAHKAYHSGIYQAGSPDDKNIGAPDIADGNAQLKGVWVKRHDTYQKNCATVASESDPARPESPWRAKLLANYDKANIGRGGYGTNLNFSTKNQKGTHELRAECLGKPQDPPGGGTCTLWKGGPASISGAGRDWDDLCRDDDLLYGAQTRKGGYYGHPGKHDAQNWSSWGNAHIHQNYDWGLAEDIPSNGHYQHKLGGAHAVASVKGFPTLKPKYNASKAFRTPAEGVRGGSNDLPATGKMCLGNRPLYGTNGWNVKGVGGRWMGHVCMNMNKSVLKGTGANTWRNWVPKSACSGLHSMTCPHAHRKIYDERRVKGDSDLQAHHKANAWCNNIPGCTMRTPSPRGVAFATSLGKGKAGVKGSPYYDKGPPLHPMMSNKTIFDNNYPTKKDQVHGKISQTDYQGANYGTPRPNFSRPGDNAWLPRGSTIFTRDNWDKNAEGGQTGGVNRKHPYYTHFHEQSNMWACEPGKGCSQNQRPISTLTHSPPHWVSSELQNHRDQPVWGAKETINDAERTRPWHKGPWPRPGGQKHDKRRFDTWRRSIRSFSRGPYDCPISPYVYESPHASGRIHGAARYIKPTGASYLYGPNKYYMKDYPTWGGAKSALGKELKKDIRNSFSIEYGTNTGRVPDDKLHSVTHINQAEYRQSGFLDTGMPNGNCYLRGEGSYGDAGREGMGLCRRMTKDGPVRMSCCDSNFSAGWQRGGGKNTLNDLFEHGNMNCQVSPHYRTNPDPRYYKKGTLYDSDSTKSAIVNDSDLDPNRNINFPDSEVYPNVGAGRTKPWNE